MTQVNSTHSSLFWHSRAFKYRAGRQKGKPKGVDETPPKPCQVHYDQELKGSTP